MKMPSILRKTASGPFHNKLLTDLFVLFIILFIGRMAFPLLKFLFAPYFFIFFGISLVSFIKNKPKIKEAGIRFIKNWGLMLVVMLAFLWGLGYSFYTKHIDVSSYSSYPIFLIRDIFHIPVYLFIVLYFVVFLNKRFVFSYFIYSLARALAVFAAIILILSIAKFTLLLTGFDFSHFGGHVSGLPNTSLLRDYNYYAYTLLIGIFSLLYVGLRKRPPLITKLTIILVPLFCLSIVLSSSRRGLVALAILIAIGIAYTAFSSGKNNPLKNIIRKSLLYFVLFFAAFSLFIGVKAYDSHQKVKADVVVKEHHFANTITPILYRYLRMIEPDLLYYDLQTAIWGEYDYLPPALRRSYDAVGTRKERFVYSMELFRDRPLRAQLFGKGFSYTTEFAQKFVSKTQPLKHDYPHNFILASLLYSGIAGTLFMIVFLFKMFYAFSKNNFRHLLLAPCFILGFYFNLPSGNSLFSVPFFFLTLLLVLQSYNVNKNAP